MHFFHRFFNLRGCFEINASIINPVYRYVFCTFIELGMLFCSLNSNSFVFHSDYVDFNHDKMRLVGDLRRRDFEKSTDRWKHQVAVDVLFLNG